MRKTTQRLFEQAMRLEPAERVALTGLLIESLDTESEADVDQAWETEVERRMAEVDSGAVRTTPWEKLRERLYGRSSAQDDPAMASA